LATCHIRALDLIHVLYVYNAVDFARILPCTLKVGWLEGKGRVLFATRDIRALDLILVDPGTVVGPNYRSKKVCLECLKLLGMAKEEDLEIVYSTSVGVHQRHC
jgi:hypothetical protein